MSFGKFKTQHAFMLALLVSVLLIMREYTDYLINAYDYDFSWFAVSSRLIINYLVWASLIWILMKGSKNLLLNPIGLWIVIQHIGLALLVAALHRLLSVRLYDFAYFLYSGFLRNFLTPGNLVQIGAGVFSSFLEYWIIMLLIVAASYYTRYLEKQKELNVAELNALQMQLHPHFLFNTLNSIASLIDIDGKRAQKMLSQLGFLMREMLEHDKKHFIPLQSEMDYIQTYLEIEHIRFQDRLTLRYQVDEGLLLAQVPALLLQPIVENAIKHGIAKRPDGGEITLKVSKSSEKGMDYLTLLVSNDFHNHNGNTPEPGYGIGTRNVSKRLDQLYGKDHRYTSHLENEKYIAEITIPLKMTT